MKMLLSIISCIAAFCTPLFAIRTDYAVFLFDNGEANMVASMLRHAETTDKETLDHLDFRIIFMGASIDAMSKEPYSHYPDKLVHYKQLGIQETIDRSWQRERKIDPVSLENLFSNLKVGKKIWTGVSCSVFAQILQKYREDPKIEAVALRDNPNPEGDTDYFTVAKEVQKAAKKVAVPSKSAAEMIGDNTEVVVIGHPSLEEWQDQALHLDKDKIIQRLGLDQNFPILMYAGVYGDYYEPCFKQFLKWIDKKNFSSLHAQIIIVPHPRHKGALEKQLCKNIDYKTLLISDESSLDPSQAVKSIEALCIADAMVIADATSTMVSQANALKKPVLYINPAKTPTSNNLCKRNVIRRISTAEELALEVKQIQLSKETGAASKNKDIFDSLGIPKNSAQLLWDDLKR